jgi:glutamate racemase
MRIALINSGLGLLAAAAALRRLQPDADLVLAMDPDGMPWGARQPDDIARRSLACARAAAAYGPDVLVFACNTGSVHALHLLREEFEPRIPVVGTVPAIKPAAARGGPVAIWATAATTGSEYQRGLIAQFAAGVPVAEVACPGLADAIHAGDEAAVAAAVSAAASMTPSQTRAIVLGCTEYELAADRIREALPDAALYGSAPAIAAQALRRAVAATGHPDGVTHTDGAAPPRGAAPDGAAPDGAAPPDRAAPPDGTATPDGTAPPDGAGSRSRPGEVHVLLSGRPGQLPPAALRYAEGRLLASTAPGHAGEDAGLPRTAVRRDRQCR